MTRMDDEMILLQNVMHVDLAIKRELEYRKKMGMSRKLHNVELFPLVVVQRPTVTGMDARKRTQMSNTHGTCMLQSSNFQPIFKPPLASGLACLVCRKPFAALFLLKQHGETLVHKGKLIHMRRQGEVMSNPFHCELCKSSCSSGSEMENHLSGKRHAESLEMFEKAKRARGRGGFTANQ